MSEPFIAFGLAQPSFAGQPLVLVMEDLTGTVDGKNKTFHGSHVPVAGFIWCVLRGQFRYEPGDFVSYGHGTDFVFTTAPRTGDPPPKVMYFWNTQAQEMLADPAILPGSTLGALSDSTVATLINTGLFNVTMVTMPWRGI